MRREWTYCICQFTDTFFDNQTKPICAKIPNNFDNFFFFEHLGDFCMQNKQYLKSKKKKKVRVKNEKVDKTGKKECHFQFLSLSLLFFAFFFFSIFFSSYLIYIFFRF